MASGDAFTITITGKQTHGAVPWGGVDPIVVGAQIVMSLQTIVSRTVNITEAPAVVTIGAFNSGNRFNIVPETVELLGTRPRLQRGRAQGHSAPHPRHRDEDGGSRRRRPPRSPTASAIPVTVNDPALTEQMVPTLKRVAGAENVRVGPLTGTAEDFSFFQQKVPGHVLLSRRDAEGSRPEDGRRRTTRRSSLPTNRRCRSA